MFCTQFILKKKTIDIFLAARIFAQLPRTSRDHASCPQLGLDKKLRRLVWKISKPSHIYIPFYLILTENPQAADAKLTYLKQKRKSKARKQSVFLGK